MDRRESHTPSFFAPLPPSAGDDDPSRLRIARSNSVGACTEALTHSFHQQQQQKATMMTSPLSLRERESASMSLKHIFDRAQMSSGAAPREQECRSTTQGQQQMGGFQGIKNQSMTNPRKCPVSELDLTFRNAQVGSSAYAQTAFGSPISISAATDPSLLSPAPLPAISQLTQHNYVVPGTPTVRINPSSRQPTAQMTIFYSGNVNVYDDVPADKAHAIMLLAGNSGSSNFRSPAVTVVAAPPPQTEVMEMRERALSPMKASPSQQQGSAPMPKTNIIGTNITRNIPSPAPASPAAAISIASPPPSPAPAPLVADGANSAQTGALARRPHAGIELPHARKASLARFLEKRKDRVQVQQVNPEQQGGDAVGEKGGVKGGEPASCSGKSDYHNDTSSSGNKKQRMCSRSPSPSRTISNGNNRDKTTAFNNQSINAEDETTSHRGTLNEHRFFG